MRSASLAFVIALTLSPAAPGQVLTGKKPVVPLPNRNIKERLSAEEQKKHFQVPEGFEVELVAAEPLVINPITMTLDNKGRIYVSESHTYRYGPSGSPVKPFRNPVVRLDPLPDGKGYKRVPVADGFDDPVMGIAIRGDKIWLSANNFLYQYDLAEDGKTSNRRTLLTDKSKAWNPFGMFVAEWGPDGLLYLSVGNHGIDITGPSNGVKSRGGSGIITRMKPDGRDIEKLVQGLRVPYSFEFDPFGQLWLLSNGEGNPDRFVRVIEGVDYHCYSRGAADNSWLAGEHPLAPPCFELMRGAHTQLLRYYGAAFPASYQGSLLADNWGAHGFNGPNRAIVRYVPDVRGNIVRQEAFLACADPHFRPSHIALDLDGSLLVCDWYGRDDESDMTGRIWRVKYTGRDRPAIVQKLDAPDWSRDDYALEALGSPDHRVREKATSLLTERKAVPKLAEHAGTAKESLGAANALWALVRIDSAEAKKAVEKGTQHRDPAVRRLAIELLRRYQVPNAAEVAKRLAKDEDAAVLVAAARARGDAAEIRAALGDALNRGAAADPHLRYEAAWHLAKHGDRDAFTALLNADDKNVRLAGLIALDVACFEAFPSKDAALAVLAEQFEKPRPEDVEHLFTLARMNWDKSLAPGVEKLLARAETPAPTAARALLLLRTKAAKVSPELLASAGKRLLGAVDKGDFPLNSAERANLYLEFLENEGASAAGLTQLGKLISGGPNETRVAAHGLARKFAIKAQPLAESLWPKLLDAKGRPEDRTELVVTLATIDNKPAAERWEKLLSDANAEVRTEAVRTWRAFKGKPEMVARLAKTAPELVKKQPTIAGDLAMVLTELGGDLKAAGVEHKELSKEALTEQTLAALAKLPNNERPRRARAGRLVFERGACTKCHTSINQNTPLAPSLQGIGKGQKPEYLVESVLFPSKIIKTGFETERIVTKSGKMLTGLVKEDGAVLRVMNLDGEVRVPKADVDERAVQKISLMPEGQEKLLSREEFLDLMAYLQSLR